jgi:murein L,D-transpeptidase YcbB/YkuD
MRFIYTTLLQFIHREDRAFSHGCIRVEKPVELATSDFKMIQNGIDGKLETMNGKMVYTTK